MEDAYRAAKQPLEKSEYVKRVVDGATERVGPNQRVVLKEVRHLL